MKILKGILFSIIALMLAACAGVMACAFNPSLTAKLAGLVGAVTSTRPVGSGTSGGTGNSTGSGTSGGIGNSAGGGTSSGTGSVGTGSTLSGYELPGINADWLKGQTGYEQPDEQSVKAPDSVSGRMGYEPVREEASEIGGEEAANLAADVGETGSDLVFDEEYYPYYAMLEPDMRQIYNQIYANAMKLNTSFAPVTDVSVNQLKTVFEAVYNDHPELFWLETGYSCKYLPDGRCAEITLKYNSTANALDEARVTFEGVARSIVGQAQGLGSAYEKEKYVHDALMQRVEYDLSAPMNQSAYSALVGGRTVCAGYARAFQYMMQLLGIPTYYCTGYAGQDHAWNIVKLDGSYYNVDVTWADTEVPSYDYFNKSDRSYAPTHMRTGLSVYLPACLEDGPAPGANAPESGAQGNAGTGEPSVTASPDPLADLINPNPSPSLKWQSKVRLEPTESQAQAEAEKRASLKKIDISEEQVRDTMQDYYEDCKRRLKESGIGYTQFWNVVPQSIWNTLELTYENDVYWRGYVESTLNSIGAVDYFLLLRAEDLGSGYYKLNHYVYIY